MKSWIHTLVGLIAACNLISTSAIASVELDRVAVIVNGGVILQSDIENSLKALQLNAKEQSLPDKSILREQVIEKLIIDAIQKQEAERIGVKIDDTRLNETIEEIAKNNEKTVEELIVAAQEEGLSFTEFREQIRDEIAISEARNALVRRRITILPSEIDGLAKILAEETDTTVQYHIGHIQLKYNDDDDKDKAKIEQQAQKLAQQLTLGSIDFNKTAYTHSKGPKALQGGDWGWMRKEEMPTIFADQIKTQGKGSIIGPFRRGNSFHILKIHDVKGLETTTITEVNARHILMKPTIILSDEGVQRQLNDFIKQIKSGKTTFGTLAKQYSQDSGSAVQNGELGYQTPDLYVPEFKNQVETLEIGQISEPFKTAHGWHIVEVLDRRESDNTDSALKNKAYRIIFNRKFNEEASVWLQEMRSSAYVEMVDSGN